MPELVTREVVLQTLNLHPGPVSGRVDGVRGCDSVFCPVDFREEPPLIPEVVEVGVERLLGGFSGELVALALVARATGGHQVHRGQRQEGEGGLRRVVVDLRNRLVPTQRTQVVHCGGQEGIVDFLTRRTVHHCRLIRSVKALLVGVALLRIGLREEERKEVPGIAGRPVSLLLFYQFGKPREECSGAWARIEQTWLAGRLTDEVFEEYFIDDIVVEDIGDGTDGWQFPGGWYQVL
ncbi:hypothetical protein [Streptomyces microflavus]|uniref:hypothetical protein n=1 Tax=Streptomyces microflavus TaxID=1919 RepID=UPI0033ECFEAE